MSATLCHVGHAVGVSRLVSLLQGEDTGPDEWGTASGSWVVR